MNILQSLADQAKKKKDQLYNDVVHAPQAIGNAVAHIGAAPHPVATSTPQVQQAITTAKYGVLANNPARQQQFTQTLRTPQPNVMQGLSNLGGAVRHAGATQIVQPFVTRPAAEVAATVLNKPQITTPKSLHGLFGDTPIQSIQQKVGSQYQRQSTSSNPLLRLASKPLAVGEGLASIANDIPVVSMAGKGVIKGTKLVAPEAGKVLERGVQQALPALKQGAKAVATEAKAAQSRVATQDGITAQQNQINSRIKSFQKQQDRLPLNNPNSPIAHENLQRKIDYHTAQIEDLQASRPAQGTVQRVTDRVLTAQPGLSMKAVHSPELSPEQNNFIEAYATDLKNMGQGNGVAITADGRRVSNNVRSAADKGKAMTNAHWFDKARQEIESGKGMYGASDEYKKLGAVPEAAPLDVPAGFETTAPAGPKVTPKPQLPSVAKAAPQKTASKVPLAENVTPLPEYGTKQVSGLDKAFRSTRSIIERQGEHGKQLAGMLQGSRDTQEIYQAQLAKQLPTVRSLKSKDFENFVEATQGKTTAKNAKVAQAVQEWQAVHPTIRQRAVDAGLDVGDLGPTYYPHFIDYQKLFKDKNLKNEAINHLVTTGQAATQEEALKLLSYAKDVSRNRSFGNLEAQRLIDLPMYDKTPNSLVSYLGGSAKRIAQTETFGSKDEKALELITKAAGQGYDTEAMKNAYDIAVGAKRYGETATDFSNKARAFQSTTRLGLGALTNVGQNVNTGIVTGHLRTLSAMAKQLSPKTRSFVADTGVISDSVLNDLKTQAGFTGKVLGKITAPGFGKVESFNRAVSATAGRDYALRLAQKGDDKTLRRLGVTGDIKGKTLSEAQQVQAARKVVEKTQFKVDPQDLPGWTDSPGGKLVSQFRSFSYAQGKFISNEVLKPAARGNVAPLARLMASLPVGYALYEAKRGINGRPEEENKTKRGLAVFQNVGGAGLAFDLYQSLNPTNSQYLPADRRVSMGVSAFGGPTAGLFTQGVGAVNDLVQRKNTPTDQTRLDGKLVVGNNGKTYTDATQAGRFGLNQIPIVGGPIRNRVLPYKAQSQADTGTSTSTSGTSTKTAKGTTPVDQLKAKEKQQNKDLKAALSPEDYKLSNLNKADRKQLISQGSYTQAKFDGLDNYVKSKKQQLGIKVTSKDLKLPTGMNGYDVQTLERKANMKADGWNSVVRKEPDAEYKLSVAELERDKKLGKLSRSQLINREEAVRKAKVGARFTKDTREMYGSLSKDEVFDLITSDNNGKQIASDLLAYGDALQKATGTQNKFRTKKGAESFQTANRGGSTGSGRTKSLSTLLAEFKTPYSDRVKYASKGASLARSAHLAKKTA